MRALIVPDIDGDPGQEPGAVEIRPWHSRPDVIAGFGFRCPCGCGREGWLPVHLPGEGKLHGGPEWEWDGDRDRPTLSPSIYSTGWPCRWHGWLKNGEWSEA